MAFITETVCPITVQVQVKVKDEIVEKDVQKKELVKTCEGCRKEGKLQNVCAANCARYSTFLKSKHPEMVPLLD